MKEHKFNVYHYPAVRQFTSDTGRIDHGKHYVRALLEVDVTNALQKIKLLRSPGKKVSFLAWFIKLLADTVAQHPPIDGIHHRRNAVITFNSVNVSTIVEKMVNKKPVPLPLVLRGANLKSHYQINEEILSAVAQSVATEGNLVLGKGENAQLIRLAFLMPQWLRLIIMRALIFNNPRRMHEMMGTVMVTSLGTLGRISGWIIPTSMHPLSIGIGSLTKKPAIFEGQIHKRDILHLTVTFDHDVIDGMPALKFVDELVSRMEKGENLD